MALTEKHIRNAFIYIIPKFASYGLNLITLPILTRILTPEDFGIIALALAFPTIAVSIVTAGMTSSVPRFYFEHRKDSNKLYALYFSVQLYLFIMLIISAVAVYFVKDHISSLVTGKIIYGPAIFIAYITAYLGQLNAVYLLLYQNMEKAVQHSSFVILQAVTSITMSLVLVWHFRMSYMGMIYGSFCGACISSLAICIHFNKSLKFIFNKSILIENIKYGLQIVPKSFSGFINRFFDKYMLNAMLSMSVVGVYSIGQKIANILDVLMDNIWMSVQPAYYREVFDKGKRASVSAGRMFTVFSYIMLLPLIFGLLFAGEIIHIIAPPSYYGAIDIIAILAAGITTQIFGRGVSVQYAYTKKPFWIFPVTVIGTIFNVVLNIILIPKYGLIGAGFATMLSSTIMNYLLTYIGQKLYRIRYEWKTLASLHILIITAMFFILYSRAMDFSNIYLYLLKLVFLILFLSIGIKARIITKESIAKASSALFKFSKA